MSQSLALFLFGFLVFLGPATVMWLDGYSSQDGESHSELIVRWLMSKTPEQIGGIEGCCLFGPFCMTLAAVMP
jgi:hypothetical protein